MTLHHTLTDRKERMVAVSRCALVRTQLVLTEIDMVAVSLQHNMISPDQAAGWLDLISEIPFLLPPEEEGA